MLALRRRDLWQSSVPTSFKAGSEKKTVDEGVLPAQFTKIAMPFVKLDTGILRSTLWVERDLREIFITALLMAEPFELESAASQIEVRTLKETGFLVPPGWYGLVPAAGVGIIYQARVGQEAGLLALEQLGNPDLESRTKAFDGRRLVRVDGGFLVLNYMIYRDKDHGAAERMRKLRARRRSVTPNGDAVPPNVTQAYADVDADVEKIKSKSLRFALPSLGEVTAYCTERGKSVDPQQWFDHYTSNGWRVGRSLMRDWRAAVRTWEKNRFNQAEKKDTLAERNKRAFDTAMGRTT